MTQQQNLRTAWIAALLSASLAPAAQSTPEKNSRPIPPTAIPFSRSTISVGPLLAALSRRCWAQRHWTSLQSRVPPRSLSMRTVWTLKMPSVTSICATRISSQSPSIRPSPLSPISSLLMMISWVKADGQLTLRGVTKPVTLHFTQFKCGFHPIYRSKHYCADDATATINRSNFGMSAYSGAVGEQVKLLIQVEAAQEGQIQSVGSDN